MASAVGYELILGSSVDAQFGPVLLFGTGGQLVEVFQDRALALPPLNTTLARRLMEQTQIFTALKGVRGRKPVDLEALERFLVRFSQLVLEQTWIREIDINPLLVSSETLLALDARVVLYAPGTNLSEIQKPAIRPYPSQYAGKVVLKDGSVLDIRPIRPEDEPEFVRFHGTLSDESVYRRYFFFMNLESRVRHERLIRMCFIDYDRQMAFIAKRKDAAAGVGEIVGVGRLIKAPGTNQAEIAVLVSDAFQKRGIGTVLVQRLIEFARDEKLQLLTASFLAENRPIERLFQSFAFTFRDSTEPEIREAELRL
jgi:acetyltransferase